MIFYLTSQLSDYSEKQFVAYVTDALEFHAFPTILDLSKIDFIDSSDLSTLMQIAQRCQVQSRSFLVVGNTCVAQTAKLVRLEGFLRLASDLPSALNQLTA